MSPEVELPDLTLIDCEPEVAFSINMTRDTVFGRKVRSLVAVRLPADVTLKYRARAGSVAPSAIVVSAFASEANDSCVA